MGIHPEHEIPTYWNTDVKKGPVHDLVRRDMSLVRWQQLDRFLHISKPCQQPGKETPFEKVEPLNEELRIEAKKYWVSTTHLTIDEAIQRFLGRAKETVNIPSKPTPEGFKIWVLANAGYILDWLFHAKGSGPVFFDDYWVQRGYSATQAVVFELLFQEGIEQDSKHVVWIDNLFTSSRLLSALRDRGFAAAGTVRTTQSRVDTAADTAVDTAPDTASFNTALEQTQQTQQSFRSHQTQSSQSTRQSRSQKLPNEVNRGLDPALAELKIYSNQIPWGKLYSCVSADGKVIQFAWKDQQLVYFMSTITGCSGGQIDMVRRVRKRPSETSTNAKTSRVPFGECELDLAV